MQNILESPLVTQVKLIPNSDFDERYETGRVNTTYQHITFTPKDTFI
jgi:hypothetical protein